MFIRSKLNQKDSPHDHYWSCRVCSTAQTACVSVVTTNLVQQETSNAMCMSTTAHCYRRTTNPTLSTIPKTCDGIRFDFAGWLPESVGLRPRGCFLLHAKSTLAGQSRAMSSHPTHPCGPVLTPKLVFPLLFIYGPPRFPCACVNSCIHTDMRQS